MFRCVSYGMCVGVSWVIQVKGGRGVEESFKVNVIVYESFKMSMGVSGSFRVGGGGSFKLGGGGSFKLGVNGSFKVIVRVDGSLRR